MTCDAFLAATSEKLDTLIGRVETAVAKVDDSGLNWKPSAEAWSIGQIIDHVLIGMEYYVPGVEASVKDGKKSAGNANVKHSWFGGMIIKGIGPGGKAPILKQLIPGPGPYPKELAQKWTERHRHLIDLAHRAEGMDLSSIKIRNPFFKLFRMNLADFFAILADHSEGHVLQIEALAARTPRSN
jgi:hypothetical protein